MKKKFKLTDLDCANCAAKMEDAIRKIEGVENASGIVQGVLGIRWYDCVVTGQASHAGPTPMRLRQDALQVATRIMQEVVAVCKKVEPDCVINL